jgi:propionyl-CoA synthetase
VELFAGALSAQGLKKGETVIIYMPMIPQAVIAMLACARLGAIHSVVFGGFAADQLTFRINHAKPKFVITASCGLEPGRVIPYKPLVDKAISNSVHKPQACIVYQVSSLDFSQLFVKCSLIYNVSQRDGFEEASMQQGRDLDWDVLMMKSYPHPCVPVAATDPLYLLYTSGTTGDPKGIVRDTGGYMVALKWSMQNIYDSHPGDVYWTVRCA